VAKPRRIHIASRSYIRAWSLNGKVAVQPDDLGADPELRNPEAVGWRAGWWGPSGTLAVAAEETLRGTEDRATSVLKNIASRWPLSRDDRAEVAQFIAIHAVRTPAWRSEYDRISLEAIGEELRRRRRGPEVERQAVTEFIGHRLRVETLIKQIPRVASVFMSMHWSLVHFSEPLIASSDQPVVCVPRLEPWQRLPIEAMPRTGFLETAEVRFPVDPWHVLLLSWTPQPDLADAVAGQFRHAADMNRSSRAQADRQWFHRPGGRPPLLAPPSLDRSCQPISYDLVPGYSLQTARESRRRSEADAIMKALIASQATDVMRFVAVTPKAAPPESTVTEPPST
jgi:hypothetical protein